MKSKVLTQKKATKFLASVTCLALTVVMAAGCSSASSVQVESSVVNESITASMNAGDLLVLSGSLTDSAGLSNPVDVCVDGSTIYVADRGNKKIQQYNFDTDEVADAVSDVDVTALCSSRGAVYFADSEKGIVGCIDGQAYEEIADDLGNVIGGMAADEMGNIYVCSTDRHCIYEINENGDVLVFAGTPNKGGYADGAASSALFLEPTALAYYDGSLYVADSGNNVIRQIKDGSVTTVAGSVQAADEVTGKPAGGDSVGNETLFNYPSGLYVYNGIIIVSDTLNNSIKAVKSDGSSSLLYGGEDAGLAEGVGESARMNRPVGIVYDGENLYLADSYNNTIRTAKLDINSISYETVHSSTVYANRTVIIYSVDKNDGAKNIVTRGAEEIEAYDGMRLTAGDTITTNDKGGLYIKVDNDKVFRLEPNSIVSITQANESKLTITLISGDLFFNVQEELGEYEEMSFIEGSITMSIRGTSGYFSHEEIADGEAVSLMLFDGKVSTEVASIGGSEEIAAEVLPGNTATIATSGAASEAGIVQEEYDLNDIPESVKEIINSDEQLKERIIESISETRGVDKTEIEKEVNKAVGNEEITTTGAIAAEDPAAPETTTQALEPETTTTALVYAPCGCLQSEVDKNPSEHKKCNGCGEYICHGGNHTKYDCGCYVCVVGTDHQLACGCYACKGGNHSELPCGHYACEEGHALLECGHCKCQDGDHYTILPCGHYACVEDDHSQASCGIEGHWNCDRKDHTAADCGTPGHYNCNGDHGLAECNTETHPTGHRKCDRGDHVSYCPECWWCTCWGHSPNCPSRIREMYNFVSGSAEFVEDYFGKIQSN